MYGTIAGLIALSIEAIGGVPQFISNQKNKSVEGLSVFMVITWFFSDFTKTLYFVVEVNKKIMLETTISIYYVWSFPVNHGCPHHHPDHGLPRKKCNVREKWERGIPATRSRGGNESLMLMIIRL